jgi:arsenate reductase
MLKLYHNPRCSKSRQALEMLREAGADFEVVEYLVTPPDRDALVRMIEIADAAPSEFVRTGDAAFREIGLTLADDASVDEIVDLLAKHPALMQRPVLVAGEKAVIGRPPEKIRELID